MRLPRPPLTNPRPGLRECAEQDVWAPLEPGLREDPFPDVGVALATSVLSGAVWVFVLAELRSCQARSVALYGELEPDVGGVDRLRAVVKSSGLYDGPNGILSSIAFLDTSPPAVEATRVTSDCCATRSWKGAPGRAEDHRRRDRRPRSAAYSPPHAAAGVIWFRTPGRTSARRAWAGRSAGADAAHPRRHCPRRVVAGPRRSRRPARALGQRMARLAPNARTTAVNGHRAAARPEAHLV